MNPISNNSKFLGFLGRLFFVSLLLSMSSEGKPPEVGFIRIVNAVAVGQGKAAFSIDGRNLYEGGYALGQTTGGYGVKAGSFEVEVSKEGVKTGKTKVNLETGETMTVIAFAELVPAGKEEDPPEWEIRLLRLKQQEKESGYGLSLVSVCKHEEIPVNVAFEGRKTLMSAFARRLAITKVELGTRRGEVVVSSGEEPLAHVSTDSPGNYVVILYQDPDGSVKAISFYDPKFVIAG